MKLSSLLALAVIGAAMIALANAKDIERYLRLREL